MENKIKALYKRMKFWFYRQRKHPVPTLEDIKEAKRLAKELKGESDRKTLDNIIEYQNRNIAYFNERTVFSFSQFYILLLSVIIAIIPFFWFSFLISLISGFTPLLPLQKGLMVFLFVILCFINSRLIQLGIVIVTVDRLRKKMKWNKFLSKEFKLSIKEAYRYAISQEDMPVRKILDWRLAICRDYAKLTASLLYNLFPDYELYFFDMPGHVVAGIKLDNEIYVLDPHYDNPTPPSVLKLDEWLIKKELNTENFFEGKIQFLQFEIIIHNDNSNEHEVSFKSKVGCLHLK